MALAPYKGFIISWMDMEERLLESSPFCSRIFNMLSFSNSLKKKSCRKSKPLKDKSLIMRKFKAQ
jgi:hypothetical protein